MYTFIRGILEEIFLEGVSVDVQGVGYFIYLSKRYLPELEPGTEVKIYTTLIHREDTMKLFGFQTKEERELFNLLTSVSGIGAKTGLGILSAFSVSDIVTSIYANDTKKLAKAPGIGLKTAQRIILELKEKIAVLKTEIKGTYDAPGDSEKIEQYEETEAALFALGYSTQEVQSALKWLSETRRELKKSDDMIRDSLMWLSSN
jgi:Holliday junction DNA helicase RuvA